MRGRDVRGEKLIPPLYLLHALGWIAFTTTGSVTNLFRNDQDM